MTRTAVQIAPSGQPLNGKPYYTGEFNDQRLAIHWTGRAWSWYAWSHQPSGSVDLGEGTDRSLVNACRRATEAAAGADTPFTLAIA